MSALLIGLAFKAQLEDFGSAGAPARKLVLLRLVDFANDDGENIYPSISRIASDTQLGARTVQRIIRGFVAQGLLSLVCYENGGRKTREYRLILDRLRDLVPTVDPRHGGGGTPAMVAPHPRHGGGGTPAMVAPKPLLEPLDKIRAREANDPTSTRGMHSLDPRCLSNEDWQRHVQAYFTSRETARKRGIGTPQWAWQSTLGPRPDEPGCLAPDAVFDALGLLKVQAASSEVM